jgi:hypothetical protein
MGKLFSRAKEWVCAEILKSETRETQPQKKVTCKGQIKVSHHLNDPSFVAAI